MTFSDTFLVTQDVASVTILAVPDLDLKSPFDELSELRRLLTTEEIAELTGLRRETISRARRDRRLRRATEKSLGDLYAVVTAITSGGVHAHLAAVLRRPQQQFGGRSIADLLQEGRVEEVLGHLGPPPAPAAEQLEDLRFDPATLAALTAGKRSLEGQAAGAGASAGRSAAPATGASSDAAATGADDRRLAALLDGDPALADLLPEIEARIRDHFGADTRIERAVVADPDEADGRDRLYLRIATGLTFDQQVERLTALLDREEGRLEPFQERLTIGIS
jgi:hypothetical protein